jgi:glutamyl-tRNA synthetase
MGYLPEAMRNYLVRLGWSHGDAEIMSSEEMIAWFDLPAINKAAARFDFQKLESINAHYLRQMPDADLLARFMDSLHYLPGGVAFHAKLDPDRLFRLRQALPFLKDRAKTFVDLVDGAAFIVATRPLVPDESAAALLDKDGARASLGALLPALRGAGDWSAPALEAAVKAHAASAGMKLGAIAQPLRAALTGRTASPGIFDVLAILGRDESLARIDDQAEAPTPAA